MSFDAAMNVLGNTIWMSVLIIGALLAAIVFLVLGSAVSVFELFERMLDELMQDGFDDGFD